MSQELCLKEHPLLDLGVVEATFAETLDGAPGRDALRPLLRLDAPTEMSSNDEVKRAVRKMLRHGGYKPAGRGKPASEYLIKVASSDDGLGPINVAVDICNIVSVHSGLPISVVDRDLLHGGLRVGLGGPDDSYVFNRSGQEIRLAGLLCLFDSDGPCANAVKDSQRTKTSETTTRTLSLIWGTKDLPSRTEAAVAWYRELLTQVGATS